MSEPVEQDPVLYCMLFELMESSRGKKGDRFALSFTLVFFSENNSIIALLL